MRVDRLAGVLHYQAHIAEDGRGTTVQLLHPDWTPSRFCIVHNRMRGTLRGFHFQNPGKYKRVVCTAGELYDVLIDLNTLQWTSFRLLPGDALEVPPGVAHGYLTLEPHTSVTYLLEGDKNDDLGLRWDDPKLGVEWIEQPVLMSARDEKWGYL